jgi:transcription-repair coupling factor (superfamily II helicase)
MKLQILKNKQLRLYFVSNPDSPYYDSDTFRHIMEVIQLQIKNCRLKLVGTAQMLIIDNVKGIEDVLGLLKRMKKPVVILEENQLDHTE